MSKKILTLVEFNTYSFNVPVLQDKKKSQILKVAVKLFSQKGFKETTMRDLAKKLGVTAPAIYNFFANKEEILVLLCEVLYTDFERIYSDSQKDTSPPLERFNRLLSQHLELIYNNFAYFQTALRYWRIADAHNGNKYSKLMEKYINNFNEIAMKLIPEENKANSFNPNFFSIVIMLIANEMPLMLDAQYKPFNFDEIAAGLSDRLRNGYARQ